MRLMLLSILVVVLSAAGGCSVKKNFYATGGSRADGTIDMAYDYREFETPIVRHEQARNLAQQKCRVWGYQDAEAFGGQVQHCTQLGGWASCSAWQVVMKYQCIGDLGATPSVPSPRNAVQPVAAEGSLGQAQWQQQQLQQLNQQSGLDYEEYQRRYRQIVGQ